MVAHRFRQDAEGHVALGKPYAVSDEHEVGVTNPVGELRGHPRLAGSGLTADHDDRPATPTRIRCQLHQLCQLGTVAHHGAPAQGCHESMVGEFEICV